MSALVDGHETIPLVLWGSAQEMDDAPGASCGEFELSIDNRLYLQVTKKEPKHGVVGGVCTYVRERVLKMRKKKEYQKGEKVLSSEAGDRWTRFWKASNASVKVWFLTWQALGSSGN